MFVIDWQDTSTKHIPLVKLFRSLQSVDICIVFKRTSEKSDKDRVKDILKIPECQFALKRCNVQNMKIKGKVIYWLMRTKQAWLMCILYKMVKR